jgi:two-component system LytT family sensor kinase
MSDPDRKQTYKLLSAEPYTPIITHRAQRWMLITTVWTVFGLVMAMLTHFLTSTSPSPLSWSSSLFREMVYAYLWLLLTPVILRLVWRFPIDIRGRWLNILLHLVLSLVVSFIHKLSYQSLLFWLEPAFNLPTKATSIFPAVYSYLDYGAMIYWIFVLIQLSVNYARMYREKSLRAAQLETQLVQAQLHALKMQLNPHFLFNTLNTILVLIDANPALARGTLLKFSELLRMVLESNNEQTVSLDKEIEFLKKYLEIEQLRFTDRLNISFNADVHTLNACVPFLILQPLAENAIRHGVAKRRGDAELIVRSFQTNGSLVLEVENNAPSEHEPIVERIGLSNTRQRLQKLYGERAELMLQHTSGGRFISHISLPFELVDVAQAKT